MLSTAETATRVWILRHGTSTFNVEGRYQGCCDAPALTETGRRAARLSGERLRAADIDVVMTSPLRRAVQTAEEALEALHEGTTRAPLKTDARLREVELLTWEGLSFAEVKRRFPEQHSTWCLRPYNLRMRSSSGEDRFPVRSLYRRARLFLDDLLLQQAGKSILLVTHGGAARALITTFLNLGVRYFHRIQQSNCGLSRLCFVPRTDQVVLELLNDTSHLGEALPKLKAGKTGVRLLLVPANGASPEEFRHLTSLFERFTVDCVFPVSPAGRATASAIFQRQPEPPCRPLCEMSLENALRGVVTNAPAERPCNVAVVAPSSFLWRLLREQFGLANPAASLLLHRPGISVVHCPGAGTPPVLQSLNAFEPHRSLSGAYI
jgi:probable phosphoglycerate mutase